MSALKEKAIHWANTFPVCCCFDSNHYTDPYSRFDCIIAAGVKADVSVNTTGSAFSALREFYDRQRSWMMGLLSYDLKNETEALSSSHSDSLHFPELYFFVPQYLIGINGDKITVIIGNDTLIRTIREMPVPIQDSFQPPLVRTRFNKNEYLQVVEQLKMHIRKGDIYEINFCQEFFAEHALINPLEVYKHLNAISPTPFSGFFKIGGKFILSASPERFLCKRGRRLISQPIKGTAKRSADPVQDEKVKSELRSSIKEQAENVMIVDLVRNDLTKSAVKGSVNVDELFGIYSFPQVHQLISTVSCILRDDLHPVDSLKNTFPMGSMTGAPKIRAMQLIEQYERSRRGAYSGAIGYISPEGDFDFNVVIRTILYNRDTRYLSFQVGGAITYASDAEQEYEECLIKASAIKTVLGLD